MLLTKTIAAAIIEKNKSSAPNAARVLLIHEDSRVIFAEKFEMGATLWYADNMRESKMHGVIHKLILVAMRNDQGDWVNVSDFSGKIPQETPVSRLQLRMALNAPKAKPDASSIIIPATKLSLANTNHAEHCTEKCKVELVVQKASKVVESFKPDSVEVEALAEKVKGSEFISLRELEPPHRHRIANEMFVSFRPNGNIILCKALRDALPWTTLNMMVTRDFKRFGVCAGKDYNVNQSGTYVNRAMCSKLTFPGDAGTIRVVLNWDDKLNMYVGDFQ
ncbi:hypothetical protein HQ81_0073 [Dickeya phage phiDP23.1]|uniref:Uncharacterized protein n=17 Tax=Aglimvirinae TaxID=2169530 RepID=I0J2X2_9CAUD|nr:hypothetical protein G379_gp121 [Dickeya phage vB-DsoM-LIMEstone1]YP_009102903.1 hypothetical protein DA66_0063 [Dickeya phage RC-2014]AIM51305.1 hypothetical protein HQ80_0095 [Dickeya phage phiD3]AIM51533.1 hypothetical protein HQ82_0148 [Dickeya phage phiDP10.3]AIM51847.1 hypothetical protein HQ81_0073 [Dickeya phage phiDP23.1]ASD51282.1 hypothetical protein [Dickeya phage JA15]ASD51480.1 hypothetical protein [Dickeya phage XF4]ATW62100.1 hypothetical protein [Dickeya phage PP35]AYN55